MSHNDNSCNDGFFGWTAEEVEANRKYKEEQQQEKQPWLVDNNRNIYVYASPPKHQNDDGKSEPPVVETVLSGSDKK